MRDLFQFVSAVIGVWIIVEVFRRTRRTGEKRRDWIPIIVISLLTIAFYVAVFVDQRTDIMVSTDVSSTIRLISELMIVIFVRYFPNRIKP